MVQYVRSTRFSVESTLERPNAHSRRLLSRSTSCELVNVKILNGAMRTKPVSAPSLTRLHSNSLDLSLQQLNNTPVHFNNCVNLTHKGPKDMTLFQDVNLHRPKNQLRKVRKLKIILLICLILRKIWKRNNTRAFNHTKVSYYLSLRRIHSVGLLTNIEKHVGFNLFLCSSILARIILDGGFSKSSLTRKKKQWKRTSHSARKFKRTNAEFKFPLWSW